MRTIVQFTQRVALKSHLDACTPELDGPLSIRWRIGRIGLFGLRAKVIFVSLS